MYSNVYYKGGSTYKGMYTDPGSTFKGIKVNGDTVTINMARPFPDMPYWGAFPANGPIPSGKASDPKTYKNHPLSTGPYMFKSYSLGKSLVLVKNPYWDPATDPARTQYPDEYDFKSQVPQEKTDQILLADTGTGQTTLTYEDLLAPDYQKMKAQSPERLTLGGQPCTYYWAPDNRKITDKKVRMALQWAFPYKDYILARSFIPGVTAIPASQLMPPGVPGRSTFNVTNHGDFQTDPAKAKSLLKSAGQLGYEIKFLFSTDDPTSVKGKDAIVKSLTESGFKATPVPTTVADSATARANPKEDINVRSAGWCSDWPSGATWLPPLYGSTHPDTDELAGQQPGRVQQQVRGLEDGGHPVAAAGAAGCCLEQPRQGDHRRSTSPCSRCSTAASPRPTDPGSRATSMTTPLVCRPGRTSGSRSSSGSSTDRSLLTGQVIRVVGYGARRTPPPTPTAHNR